MTEAPILQLRGVSKSFGSVEILRDVSLDVHAGVRHLLIGPNGAGKTTLFHVINGHYAPSSGRIDFEGRDVTSLSVAQRARKGIGRTFQVASLFPRMSVWENLVIAAQAPGLLGRPAQVVRQQADEALNLSGLADKRSRMAGNLAYGEQRLLEIAMALATKPRMLLLDEPMAGLTQTERLAFAERAIELSSRSALLLIEHDLEIALRIAERVTVLSLGAVVYDGKASDVLTSPIVREIYLG